MRSIIDMLDKGKDVQAYFAAIREGASKTRSPAAHRGGCNGEPEEDEEAGKEAQQAEQEQDARLNAVAGTPVAAAAWVSCTRIRD